MARSSSKTLDLSLPERLLDAGERLFGVHGLEGVSLRQISAAAGTRNNYAVQYHFGDGAGLIRAIVARRIPEFELNRAARLARLSNEERIDTRYLLEANFRAYFESGPIPAQFVLALLSSSEGWKPLDDAYAEMPIMQRIIELLAEANPGIPLRIIWQRLRSIAVMILTTACNYRGREELPEISEAMLDDAFDMGAAALSVPVGPGRDVLVKDAERYFAR